VPIVREIFRLYIALGGAKAVARELNGRGLSYRTGVAWTKDLVLCVIDQTAIIGTYYWGKRRDNRLRPRQDWLPLMVNPIVDRQVYDLAQKLRRSRDPRGGPGRAVAKPHLLSGMLQCGQCGASYQLETSGKKVDGETYRYCYYNCRNALRAGIEVCAGFRIPTEALDAAVLEHIASVVCTAERSRAPAARHSWEVDPGDVAALWRTVLTSNVDAAREYLVHLVERVEVHRTHIVVVPWETAAHASAVAAQDFSDSNPLE